MSITKESGRQDELIAKVEFGFANVADNAYEPAVDLPSGAIVTGGGLTITELFNSATTDTFAIGDQVQGAAARPAQYAAQSADVTVAPTHIPIVPTGEKYAKPATVGVRWDGTGAVPTAGKGLLVVKYVIDKRAHSSEG
jgi:hypothetical protein